MNLKLILLKLGNHLVIDHSFAPPVGPVQDFTIWLNGDKNARDFLKSHNVFWPMTFGESFTPDDQTAKEQFKVLIYAVMRETPADDREPVWALERFLNNTPVARQFLNKEGVDWPMTPVHGLVQQADILRGK